MLPPLLLPLWLLLPGVPAAQPALLATAAPSRAALTAKEAANEPAEPKRRPRPTADEPLPAGFVEDARGRRFRVSFDAGSHVLLGLGLAFTGERQGEGRERLQEGLAYRSLLEFAAGDERVTWQLDHQLLASTIEPRHLGRASLPATDATLYRGVFLRHASSSTITLPTSPPRQIFFPLDLGVQTELGRVCWPGRAEAGGTDASRVVRLGLAQASVLLDPWRSGRPGNSLELGLGTRYGMDLVFPAPDGWATPDVVHRVAPFTAASLRYRLQDAAGLTIADLRGELVPHWASPGGWLLATEVHARLERVLVALNDEPLAAYAELRWNRWPPWQAGELEATAGLALLLQLR